MTSEIIARELLQIKAIKLSPQKPFTWSSGLKSPIYCDNRTVLSYPVIRTRVIEAFVENARRFSPFDVIAGVATAGIPHAALIADQLELPQIYVRSEAKKHGLGNQIEGQYETGQRVLVIEDLLSTGGSSLKAVEALRATGLEVAGVMAIFSYGFDTCVQAFKAADCKYYTLTDYATLIKYAIESRMITDEEYQILKTWNHDPAAWSAAHVQ